MDRTQSAKGNLKEIHDRIIYDILQHFKALMNLATTLGPRLALDKKVRDPDDSDAESEEEEEQGDAGGQQEEEDAGPVRPENVAVVRVAMKQEFDALYTQFKELLAMNRRMKELWTFGKLGNEDPGQRAREEQLDADVKKAYGLLKEVEKMNLGGLASEFGGEWEVGGEEAGGSAAGAGSAVAAASSNGASGAGVAAAAPVAAAGTTPAAGTPVTTL